MKFKRFVEAAKKVKLPDGNWMFLGGKTKVLYWFMVNKRDYDSTMLMTYNPGSKDYDSMLQARELHRKCDNKGWHKKVAEAYKTIK